MSGITFLDDNLWMAKCFAQKDYSEIENVIAANKVEMTEQIRLDEKVYGYHITRNHPVSELYGMDCFVVKFVFFEASQLHEEAQEAVLIRLLEKLKATTEEKEGYYNLRLPTHIVDLVKAFNKVFSGYIFCGGTVEEMIHGKEVDPSNRSSLDICFADAACVQEHKERLMNMTLESFKAYQGQYHISYVTQDKAGQIYENWIRTSIETLEKEKVVVAKENGVPVGFVTAKETEHAVEGVLSAVDPQKRKLGAYKAMIAYLVNYANGHGKSFVTSTQFDNFIVQGAWNSLGLKPFYSIYNMHIDSRKETKEI